MKKYFIFLVFIFLSGCAVDGVSPSANQNICKTTPSWVLNVPVEKGVVYGVGIAHKNFYGEQAQRTSAISRAIDEISRQLQTTVNSQLVSNTNVQNGSVSRSLNTVSFQTVDGQKVSAVIVKSCKNPIDGTLYILMKTIK